MQATLSKPITLQGVGLHSGAAVAVTILPAPADHGICFVRTDVAGADIRIPALFDRVVDTELSTSIADDSGYRVATIEHLMAALAGTGIFNAIVRVDGPEVPIMDGSAEDFVLAILAAGVHQLDKPIRAYRIRKAVSLSIGDVMVSLSPLDGVEIDFRIEFGAAAIGSQAKSLNMANGAFVRELSDSRTFCEFKDVRRIEASGLGQGAGLDNVTVVDGSRVLNAGGFRYEDECVRHKMLDALGDLALAGAPILGRYCGVRAGHKSTNQLLRTLFARPDAWDVVHCDAGMSDAMPGYDIKPEDLWRTETRLPPAA